MTSGEIIELSRKCSQLQPKGSNVLSTYLYTVLWHYATFASDVRSEPLRSVVVEEALGVGETHGEVPRVAGVLEHGLQGEVDGVGSAVVGRVLNDRRIHAEHYGDKVICRIMDVRSMNP